jgi:regulator of sigma E protease
VITIPATIILLSVLVVAHEAGHFAAAKLSGIRVLRFSLGFWKVLLSFKWRGTEYALSLVPLGGYVKMAGSDESEREGKPDEFLSKPPWVRMIVAFAGPAMNFVLAVLVFAVVGKAGYTVHTFPNRVDEVLDKVQVGENEIVAPARSAGFEVGDVILAVDGKPTPHWYDIQRIVKTNAGKRLSFDVRRGDRTVVLEAKPALDPDSGQGFVGLVPYQANDVSNVLEDSLADKAGIVPGDKVVSFGGRPTATFNDFIKGLDGLPAGRHLIGFEKANGEPVTVAVEYDGEDPEAFLKDLGVACGFVEVKVSETWLTAIPAGAARTWEATAGTARGMILVFRGKVKVTKALGGPLTIARYAGETARAGVIPYLEYMGILSVMLGMLNLLPIPVLDGGHIVIGVFETIRRKNMSAEARGRISFIGMVLLGAILLVALFADFRRLVGWG